MRIGMIRFGLLMGILSGCAAASLAEEASDSTPVIQGATSGTFQGKVLPSGYKMRSLDVLTTAPVTRKPFVPGKNLAVNGDLESCGPNLANPVGWESLKKGVSIVEVGGEHKHAIKLTLDKQTAENEGLAVYSKPIPVVTGKKYRVFVDVLSEGPEAFVFVKGYADLKGREREIYRMQQAIYFKGGNYIKKNKEVIEQQENRPYVQPKQWGTVETFFTPRHSEGKEVLDRRKIAMPEPDRIRVDFFTYGAPGVIYFDNLRVYEDNP